MRNEFSLEVLGDQLDDALAKGQLPDPSAPVKIGTPNEMDSAAYRKVVRQRLISLGYLKRGYLCNSSSCRVDEHFIIAVKQFQREIGTRSDGWLGPKSWRMLDSLVSFENEQDPALWLQSWRGTVVPPSHRLDIATNSAVQRATYLRLYTMGFFDSTPNRKHRLKPNTKIDPSNNASYRKALKNFVLFAKSIGLIHTSLPNQLSMPLLQLIFGFDVILSQLAIKEYYRRTVREYYPQMEAVARIELWLSGYDVQPIANESERLTHLKFREIKSANQLKQAITDFWSDTNSRENQPKAKKSISFKLFTQFNMYLQQPSEVINGESEDEIKFERDVERLLRSKHDQNALSQQLKRIASTIWDGVKRVARWLFRIVTGVVKRTINLFTNLARYIANKAREAYICVVRVIDIVQGGLHYLQGQVAQSSHIGTVILSQEIDFDQHCIFDPNAAADILATHMAQYRTYSKVYIAATRILCHLFAIANRVFRAAISPIGWLSALLALSLLANHFRAIQQEVDQLRSYKLNTAHPLASFQREVT
ncbi:hypothetical protein [Photobacterium indicum]|uniref:Peptidoglycan binding-like domain-containing protein n=1 Tax=Photobacterium indicum TaxID=81447 RepID=A0A2T3LF78_9GAMM|nr:hypothetical protein [Photobacterium indicum]PSV49998.1 hypothetical protein C9J47_05470 [Photobacterium indicum]